MRRSECVPYRAGVMQRKTQRPVQFEITETARESGSTPGGECACESFQRGPHIELTAASEPRAVDALKPDHESCGSSSVTIPASFISAHVRSSAQPETAARQWQNEAGQYANQTESSRMATQCQTSHPPTGWGGQ